MDYGQYYITTILNAAKNLGPMILLLVVCYVIFFKLSYIQIRKKEDLKAQVEKPEAKTTQEQIKIEDKTQKEEKKKVHTKPRPSKEEAIFQFEAGESFTLKDLRKKYHKLLKDHHPDKVAHLDEYRKNLAEKKTKEINSAYESLKKKAS